jgi:chloride channel protein, CIC family
MPTAQHRSQSGKAQVFHVMRPAAVVLSPDTEVVAAVHRVQGEPFDAWPVADDGGLWGMIRKSALEEAASNGRSSVKLSEIAGEGPGHQRPDAEKLPHVHPDHGLSLVLERMGATGFYVLPVVSRANVRQLLGVVVLDDVLHAYGVER